MINISVPHHWLLTKPDAVSSVFAHCYAMLKTLPDCSQLHCMSLKLEVEPESIEVNGNATTNQGNMTSYHWSVVILSLPYTVHKIQTRLYLYVMHNKS